MERSPVDGEKNDNENDYSASICAIIQRRNSTRRQSRRKRRPSSPFGPDIDNVMRRRSSAYTTSSGELVFALKKNDLIAFIFLLKKLSLFSTIYKVYIEYTKYLKWTWDIVRKFWNSYFS